jgi:hypothetical protein
MRKIRLTYVQETSSRRRLLGHFSCPAHVVSCRRHHIVVVMCVTAVVSCGPCHRLTRCRVLPSSIYCRLRRLVVVVVSKFRKNCVDKNEGY